VWVALLLLLLLLMMLGWQLQALVLLAPPVACQQPLYFAIPACLNSNYNHNARYAACSCKLGKQAQLQHFLCQLLQACLLAENAAAQLACTSDSAAVGSTGLLKDASSTPDGRFTATIPNCRCFGNATKQLSV
jgi:hypothetical protein